MKKSIYIFGIFFLFGLSAYAQEDHLTDKVEIVAGVKNQSILVGNWRLFDFDIGMEIPEGQEEMFNEMRKEMIANSTISFKADGTYSQNDLVSGEIRTHRGTYSIEEDELTTITTERGVDGVKSVSKISKLSKTEVTFSLEDRGSTMTMTFTRI